jgi:uncharacterized protein (DUF433 family)
LGNVAEDSAEATWNILKGTEKMRSLELADDEYADIERIATEMDLTPREVVVLLFSTAGSGKTANLFLSSTRVAELQARVYRRLGLPLGDRIRSRDSVMGGAECIRDTRIPVWMLVAFKRQGMSDGELLRSYPSLEAADLAAAWDFFAAHPERIESYIQANSDEEVG